MDISKRGSISDIFINRPVMTVLLCLSSLVFGLYSYYKLPVNDLPGVDYPVIQVTVSYPGADPSIMGATIASPLEQQFMQIPGIEMVTSRNSFGSTSLVLQFALNKSIDAAATDVQSAIQRASGNLPSDLPSPPSFTKDNPNDMPIYILNVSSDDMSDGKLYDYAFSQIAQQINMVDGVSKVDMYGIPSAVRLEVDVKKLYALGFSMTHLNGVLARSTNMIGSGNLDGNTSQYVLFPDTQLSTASDYDNLVVGYKEGSPIFLKEIAKAVDSVQIDTFKKNFWLRSSETTQNGKSANVAMGIRKRADGNAVSTVDGIKKLLEKLKGELPSSIKIDEFYDRSQLIVANINDVEETLVIAFILVVFVIFLFLGRFRDTLIPTIALPFSLVLTFIFMNYLGYSLNNLSLMGLTMAIGFLVDDAIVFLENTVRRMEDYGETPMHATFASAREISFTILSMTLSLAAVFIPLVFMSGLTGRVFKEFSVTIVVATLMSGVVSLTLTPMMCARILSPRSKNHDDKTAIEKVAHKIEKTFLNFYGPTLSWMLKQNFLALLILGGCIYGTYYFAMNLPKIFFPLGDSGFAQGVFMANTKTSSREMGRMQDLAANVLATTPDVRNFVLISGIPSFMNQNMGFGFIVLNEKHDRRPITEVINEVNGRISSIPGLIGAFAPQPTLKISTGATNTQQGKYAYALQSMNQDELYKSAQLLMMKMGSKMGVYFSNLQSDLFLDNPQVTLSPFKEKMSMLGMSANSYTENFKSAYSKFYFYLIKSPFQQYWSIMEAKFADRSYISNLNDLAFGSDVTITGGMTPSTIMGGDSGHNAPYTLSSMIPFRSISTVKTELKPVTVNHINNFPSVTIFFDLSPDVAIGDVTSWVEEVAAEVVPTSVEKRFVGEAVTFAETMKSLLLLAGVAIFVMYVIMGVLYESYVHPLTVLTSLPVAIVGGLASLYFLGMELSIYSAIGVFMLMGIVKKNGIMVVDFAIALERKGYKPIDAVHEACMERFRPIIMTTFAALMGMMPIAFGLGEADAESRIPLGVVVVGGLIFSQLVTLYLTPVVYLWFEWLQREVLDRIPLFQRGNVGPVVEE